MIDCASKTTKTARVKSPTPFVGMSVLLCLLSFLTISAKADSPPLEVSFEDAETRIIKLANQERTNHGLHALSVNPTLQKAARGHSAEMGKLNYFDHKSPNRERQFPWDRMNLLGVDSNDVGENIFMTDGHPLDAAAEMAVRGWINSAHHRENLLNPRFKSTGLGLSKHAGRIYFTQIFASDINPLNPEGSPMQSVDYTNN